jgi:polyphosphate glucokinase
MFPQERRARDDQQGDSEGSMNVLVIDVGGTHVKILATGQNDKREFASGPKMTAEQMVSGVRQLAGGWSYDAVSIGYPGPVLHNRPVADPKNLGPGWMGFDFKTGFGRPTKVLNDAAMQALGSYKQGKMLFLGLGTGLGSTLILRRSRGADGAWSSALQESHL